MAVKKALEINLDKKIYGTFAEIGAGQEVARHFFRAGGAAGTIAKSMSAYDMTISDAIYGKAGRYVSLERLQTILAREFEQLKDRLQSDRGSDTSFFVFADTVAAKSYSTRGSGNGWMGVIFQDRPGAKTSRVVLHLNMLDRDNLQQQEVLGIVGTNLVYACYHYSGDYVKFINSLMDDLSQERIEIDMIEVSGPAFVATDPRIWCLELVKQNMCYSVMFAPKGEVLLAKDCLYKKNILICRGSFRPPTLLNIDMLDRGRLMWRSSLDKGERDNILVLPEISMNKLRERGEVYNQDFLARVDLLAALGHHTMVSNYQSYGDLSLYLSDCSKKSIAFIFGHYNLEDIFDESRYQDNPGGLLGGVGNFLGHRTTLYCYPAYDEKSDKVLFIDDFAKGSSEEQLIYYLVKKKKLNNVDDYNRGHFKIWSRKVLEMIQSGDPAWESMVPSKVAKQVREKKLFSGQ